MSDGTDHLNLTFFSLRGPHARMRVGEHAIFSGKVTKYDKKLQLTHPEYQSLGWEGDVDAAQVRQTSRSRSTQQWRVSPTP